TRFSRDWSSDVCSSDLGLFESGFLQGGNHPLCHGLTEEIPYLKKQERLTFARVGLTDPLSLDDYSAHGGWNGLQRALAMTPEQRSEERRVGNGGRSRRE